jgi:amino acid transporter
MSDSTPSAGAPRLRRALGLRDLVLLNVACIVGLSNLAQVAQFGWGSLSLYALAALVFLVPSGVAVAELNARMPEEGGFYRWVRTAFGEGHGYVAAWTYWLSTIVYLPGVVVLVAVSALYTFGERHLGLAEDPAYTSAACIALVWIVTGLNLLGVHRAKWIQNVGAAATGGAVLLLIVVAAVQVSRTGSAHAVTPAAFVPDLADFDVLPFFAMLAFGFGGLELAPVMAGEVVEPRRTLPRALWIAAALVCAIYMLGTGALIAAVPEGEVDVVSGVVQALHELGGALGAPLVGVAGAVLVALGTLGLFGAWLTGAARVPFVIGLDHYLPEVFGRVHPRTGAPWVALVVQAVVLTGLLVASSAGATVKEAYLVLLDMSIILYFVPFLYIFAALVSHVRRDTGGAGTFPWLRSRPGLVWLVAGSGFGITALSAVLSAVPSGEVESGGMFVSKVLGGAVLLTGVGMVFYRPAATPLPRTDRLPAGER